MTFVVQLMLAFLIVCAVAVCVTRNLLASVVIYMGYSLIMSVVWITLESPDLAITEAAVGAGVTSLLLFLTLKKIHAIDAVNDVPEHVVPEHVAPVNDAPVGDAGPVHAGPVSGAPSGGEPGDEVPGDGEPGDGEPGDGEPGDEVPSGGEPGDGMPSDGEPGDGEPGAGGDAHA